MRLGVVVALCGVAVELSLFGNGCLQQLCKPTHGRAVGNIHPFCPGKDGGIALVLKGDTFKCRMSGDTPDEGSIQEALRQRSCPEGSKRSRCKEMNEQLAEWRRRCNCKIGDNETRRRQDALAGDHLSRILFPLEEANYSVDIILTTTRCPGEDDIRDDLADVYDRMRRPGQEERVVSVINNPPGTLTSKMMMSGLQAVIAQGEAYQAVIFYDIDTLAVWPTWPGVNVAEVAFEDENAPLLVEYDNTVTPGLSPRDWRQEFGDTSYVFPWTRVTCFMNALAQCQGDDMSMCGELFFKAFNGFTTTSEMARTQLETSYGK